ncbi:Thaumatin-like protein [Hibiscus syriacus]|uniref:Thaumatin-like protein n=1 Tax=Hibiscus syriacus TaxID=106335 RepID=A0A6A2X3N5_HIBSY|nr:Thaumatin-like protein [Hibiscus syriacus]
MQISQNLFIFIFFFSSCIFVSTDGIQLILVNNCKETIWPGILVSAGHEAIRDGGFPLACSEQTTLELPERWSGRIWPRQGCCFDEKGKGSCQTGDCAGLLQCQGIGGKPPATLVEMTLGGSDVSFTLLRREFSRRIQRPGLNGPYRRRCRVRRRRMRG